MIEEDEEILKKKIVYDFFIDENPDVKERVERAKVEARAEGFAKGFCEGKILGYQNVFITAIETWFPTLLAQAQPLIKQLQNLDELEELIEQLASAASEDQARRILLIQEKQ